MTPIGIGVDLVEVDRFGRSASRWGDRLLNRLFSDEELAYARSRPASSMQHLAARFAAKEAVVKALGAPKGLGMQWKDLSILPGPGGKPQARFTGSMRRWATYRVHLSLTHTRNHAVATALILE